MCKQNGWQGKLQHVKVTYINGLSWVVHALPGIAGRDHAPAVLGAVLMHWSLT